MVVAEGCAENLILPVGVCIAQLGNVQALDTSHQTLVLCRIQHVILLGNGRNGDVAIVGQMRNRGSLFALLGGDDDHTVRCARTINSCSRGVLQNGERLNVVRVDHSHHVTHTCCCTIGDGQSVDNQQRVIAGIQRSTTTNTNLGSGTWRTTAGDNVNTGNLTNKHIRGVVGDTLTHVVWLHGCDRTSQVVLLSAAITNDNHVLQNVLVFLQGDHQLAGGLDGSRLIAYIRNGDVGTLISLQ